MGSTFGTKQDEVIKARKEALGITEKGIAGQAQGTANITSSIRQGGGGGGGGGYYTPAQQPAPYTPAYTPTASLVTGETLYVGPGGTQYAGTPAPGGKVKLVPVQRAGTIPPEAQKASVITRIEQNETELAETPRGGYVEAILGRPGESVKALGPGKVVQRAEPGIPGLTARGSIGERGFTTYVQTGKYFAEAGERVGGGAGRVAGGLIGGGIGIFTGAYEASFGTVGRLGGVFTERTSGSKVLGDVVEIGVPFVAGYGLLGKGLKAGAPFVLAQGAKVGAKAAPVATRLAPNLMRGFGRGLAWESKSIYASKASLVGATLKSSLEVGKQISKVPGVKTGLYTSAYITAPAATSKLVRETETAEVKGLVSRQDIRVGAQRALDVSKPTGFWAQTGEQVGTGLLGPRFSSIGGGGQARYESALRQQVEIASLPVGQREQVVKALGREYQARQTGVVFGLSGISIRTEQLGQRMIAPIIDKSIANPKAWGLVKAGKGAKSFYSSLAAAKNIVTQPGVVYRFGALGAYEGLVSQAVVEGGQRKLSTPLGLPRAISERPAQYALAGAAGAGSAMFLGATVAGFGALKSLSPGSKTARIGGFATEQLGNILDPYENLGDVIARSARIKVPTVSFLPTLGEGKAKARAGIANFVGTPSGGFTIGAPTGTPTPIRNEIIIPGETPTPIKNEIGGFTDFITPIETPTPESIYQPTETFTGQPTFTFTPVPTPVPVSKAGLPLLFPPGRYGEGGSGTGRKKRLTYYNELTAAFSQAGRNFLGPSLYKRGRAIGRQFKTGRKKRR